MPTCSCMVSLRLSTKLAKKKRRARFSAEIRDSSLSDYAMNYARCCGVFFLLLIKLRPIVQESIRMKAPF